ncbi:MAG: Queuine tRNA-ribosyltransferase [Microgenomates group bacterium GW2011_GWC1_46_20]|nr:MAG: Queuine tRNA-ribosyltransferase [Microgenomates group bacterium GW2011_GWC1_46_20]
MPVGTNASVKSLSREDLEGIGATIILANNYHLYLRPGSKNIKKLGGIHKFMNWPHTILTDSGGFQIQSLKPKITDEGAEFVSHLDGSKHFFTPESATKSQIDIGADIIMAFDHSVPKGASHSYARAAVTRTHQWLIRCIKVAIGGAVIGSDPHQTADTISSVKDLLPSSIPLYAMGVGIRPSDIISVIKAGADMFDCVAPTRLARVGLLYNHESKNERIDINQSKYKLDKKPIDDSCDCSTCKTYTRAYLHHLCRSRELLFYRLA